MDDLFECLNSLYTEEFHESALLLAETLYIQTNDISFLQFIIKTLISLFHYERALNIINQNKILLENYEIKKLYLKAIAKVKSKSIELPSKSINTVKSYQKTLNEASVIFYYQAQAEKDTIRYKLLHKAFLHDNNNLQALYVIKLECLCDSRVFYGLLDSMENKRLSVICKQMFQYVQINPCSLTIKDEFDIYSPFTFLYKARKYYAAKERYKLFELAVFMNRYYQSCHISSIVLGLYYLHKKQYQEAKKALYDAITKNNEFGLSWLCFGIALSHVKEGMNSLSSFKNAEKYMLGSYKTSLYLAREYSLLNDPESASIYYKKTLQTANNKVVYLYYAMFLLHEERTQELDEIIGKLVRANLNEVEKYVLHIITFFSCLNTGKCLEAEKMLDERKPDWRYFFCKGFCYHIKGDLLQALEYYHEAEICCETKVGLVQDLMKFSMLEKTDGFGIDIVDYLIDVFDALDLCSLIELPI